LGRAGAIFSEFWLGVGPGAGGHCLARSRGSFRHHLCASLGKSLLGASEGFLECGRALRNRSYTESGPGLLRGGGSGVSGPEGAVGGMILVVDDDEAVRVLLLTRLGFHGFPTVSASSVKEAFGVLHRGIRPCLILIDVMMPRLTGWDFAEQLLKNPDLHDIPVTLMSANPVAMRAYHRVRGEERKSLLPKPVDPDELLRLACEHCRCRAAVAPAPL
jgi:CheY-like chemotaxis protein